MALRIDDDLFQINGTNMTALILLFALGIWILLTLAASLWGRKWMRRAFPQKKWAGSAGAFAGFMLLMGGWWVYWSIEYIQVRTYAHEMCQRAGIKVYMVPEEWKAMVGGEDAWRNIQLLDRSVPTDMWDKTIIFNQQEYKISHQINERVFTYTRYKSYPYILMTDKIYYDSSSKRILFQYVAVNVGTSSTNVISGLKFWINAIPSCEDYRLWGQYKNLYFLNHNK